MFHNNTNILLFNQFFIDYLFKNKYTEENCIKDQNEDI